MLTKQKKACLVCLKMLRDELTDAKDFINIHFININVLPVGAFLSRYPEDLFAVEG